MYFNLLYPLLLDQYYQDQRITTSYQQQKIKIYMNQTRPSKRIPQTVPSFREDFKHPLAHRRNTRTPELRSKTPRNKNMQKNKKTPVKQQANLQTRRQPLDSVINNKKQPSLFLSSKPQPTLCSTTHIIKTTDLPCKQCSLYQQQINSLQTQLTQQAELNHQLSNNFHELKNSYQKKLKQYKVKNRLMKEELKLLKWILGQRKEFHEVLEQFQVVRERKRVGRGQEQEESKQDIRITNRKEKEKGQKMMDKDQLCESKKDRRQSNVIQTRNNHQNHHIEPQNNPKIQNPQQSSQLQQQINILQQIVMQLSIKNDFLQKLKAKPQQQQIEPRYSFSNLQQPNRISFSHQQLTERQQFIGHEPNNSDCKRMPLHLVHQHPVYSYRAKPYQYSDDYDSLSKDKDSPRSFLKQNCWNAASKQIIRPQVESRYMSPLKERLIEENVNQSSKKKQFSSRKQSQPQDHTHIQIPQSRSKYCDSIKQRSRLLGL